MGTSCLLTARVNGWSREPEPPARMMPFSMAPIQNLRAASRRAGLQAGQSAARAALKGCATVVSKFRAFVASHLSKSEPVSVVAARLYLLAPVAVLEIPLRGACKAVLERVSRRPPELATDLRRVDRVAPIVSRAVGHEGFQIAIPAAVECRVRARRSQLLEDVACPIDNLQIGPLVAVADIILFARTPLRQHLHDPGAEILDVQPVAHVAAVAVDR